jgi:hypothetical protein
MKILSCAIVLTACLTAFALAQAPQKDQSNHQPAPQQKSQQYVPPPLSPAERMRCSPLRLPELLRKGEGQQG